VPAYNLATRLLDDATVLTFDASPSEGPVVGLDLAVSAPRWRKPLSLEVSDDGTSWTPVLDRVAFVREQPSSLAASVALPYTQARHFRLTLWDRRTSPITVTDVSLRCLDPSAPAAHPGPITLVSHLNAARETRLTFSLPSAGVWLSRIRLDLGDLTFQRRYRLVRRVLSGQLQGFSEQELASGMMSRLASQDGGRARTAEQWLSMELQVPLNELTLVIENGDNPPLSITGMAAEYRPLTLVFTSPASGECRLFLGNPSAVEPGYDIKALAGGPRNVTSILTEASFGPVLANPAYRQPEVLPTAPLFAADLEPHLWRESRAVIVSRPGVQVLELDLPALASGTPEMTDFRLVRGRAQVPHVMERCAFSRAHALTLRRQSEPPSGVSRWELQFPLTGPRNCSLRLRTSAALFDRQVSVYSTLRDSHGRAVRSLLGQVRWQCDGKASKTGQVLDVPLQGPLDDTGEIEIADGDNLPLPLDSAELLVPVVRLHFKTADTETLHLLSGYPRASMPLYDLRLVAAELMQAEHSEAKLGPAPGAGGAGARNSLMHRLSGLSAWVFWATLILVVVVLVIVIARLLPKPRA